ncbi:unnamed protein product [Peniophora sp. CBMAI 1063]|nr:unnamed protein product [Peniophora sp. CBMAI 1063]
MTQQVDDEPRPATSDYPTRDCFVVASVTNALLLVGITHSPSHNSSIRHHRFSLWFPTKARLSYTRSADD